MNLLKSSLTIAALASFNLAPSLMGQITSATTDPVGFAQVDAPAGTSLIVPGFVQASLFTGQSAVTGQTFASDLTPGTLGPTTGDLSYPTHYVQVLSGSQAGFVYDVTEVNAQGDIVCSDVPAALDGQTVQIVVRPHTTLSSVFNGATGLTAFNDAVAINNADGTTSIRYFDGAGWVADDFSTPAGQTVVYPGQGFTLTAAGIVKLTTVGSVQTANTAVPLYAGVVNLVGVLNPGAPTLVSDLGISADLVPYTDAISTFEGDGNMGSSGVYYSDGSTMLDSGFSPLPPDSAAAVPANGGFAANVTADSAWIAPAPAIAD
jgi:hypothetical protein